MKMDLTPSHTHRFIVSPWSQISFLVRRDKSHFLDKQQLGPVYIPYKRRHITEEAALYARDMYPKAAVEYRPDPVKLSRPCPCSTLWGNFGVLENTNESLWGVSSLQRQESINIWSRQGTEIVHQSPRVCRNHGTDTALTMLHRVKPNMSWGDRRLFIAISNFGTQNCRFPNRCWVEAASRSETAWKESHQPEMKRSKQSHKEIVCRTVLV